MTLRPARGAALVTVLLVLLLVGGLVAVTFPPALEQVHAARNSIKLYQAAAAAQSGAEEVVALWPDGRFSNLALHDSVLVGSAALASQTGWYRGVVRRLGADFYVMLIEGFSRDTIARKTIGAVVRRVPLNLGLRSPVSTEGEVLVTAPGAVVQSDSLPPGWDACGQYPAVTDHYVSDTTARTRFDSVASRMSSRVHPALGPGTAELGGQYFSVFESIGDLVLTGGEGGGILLVRGALTLQGDVKFRGLIVVDGPFSMRGGEVFGGVVVASNGASVVVEKGSIVYSSCLLRMAYAELGEVEHIKRRWFFPLR